MVPLLWVKKQTNRIVGSYHSLFTLIFFDGAYASTMNCFCLLFSQNLALGIDFLFFDFLSNIGLLSFVYLIAESPCGVKTFKKYFVVK